MAVLMALVMSSCTPAIAPFSARAYEQAVDLKVDALRIMERAEEPFDRHRSRVESLQVRLQKAAEYAKGRPRNEVSARQWEIMIDPDGYMAGGFLKRWEEKDSLTWGFIREATGQIESGFDTIIALESGKTGSDKR